MCEQPTGVDIGHFPDAAGSRLMVVVDLKSRRRVDTDSPGPTDLATVFCIPIQRRRLLALGGVALIFAFV